MLSINLRHLMAQVDWYHRAGLLHAIGPLVVERLGVYADDAAHLEGQPVPDAAKVDAATAAQYGGNVASIDEARRARGRR